MNCFNGELYLKEAIDSVINQTYKNWELIFWDNCSSDKSAEIFHSFSDKRLRYFCSEKHTGLGLGRKLAYEQICGEFLAVLDVDDVWYPKKLEQQIKFFDDQEVGIVISDTLFFNELKEKILYNGTYPQEGYVFSSLFLNYFVSLETLVLRKSVIDKLDYSFDADFDAISDFDIVVRASRISKLCICKEVLAKWRVHDLSDSWLSPVTKSIEKDKWLAKQLKHIPGFQKEYGKEIKKFIIKNQRSKALSYLVMGKRLMAFRSLFSFKSIYPTDLIIIVFCFLPLSGAFIGYYQMKRTLT